MVTPESIIILSRDKHGCRHVQEALEEAPSNSDRELLVGGLRGHVWELLRCPHGNHVLQKCVETLPSVSIQFIVDEILADGVAGGLKAARHRFGCRVVLRILEQCPAAQVQLITDAVADDAVFLSTHIYANFVVQAVIERGTEPQRQRLVQALTQNVPVLGVGCACAVLGSALQMGPGEEPLLLARAMLAAGVLPHMARHRHGCPAVKSVLEVLQDEEREQARDQLLAHHEGLGACRYGKIVLKAFTGAPAPAGRARAAQRRPAST